MFRLRILLPLLVNKEQNCVNGKGSTGNDIPVSVNDHLQGEV